MPDIWVDVDTALASVPVNIFPLIDDTDFKTREVAVAYNAGGMDLSWNFVTTAGVMTQTAVTPTTSGVYDWAHAGDGMYTIEMPASGGASINNDTEGSGWFSGIATGVLPWRGPILGFRHAALNNSLIDVGTTGLLAPSTAGRTLVVDAAGLADANMVKAGPSGSGSAQTAGDLAALINTIDDFLDTEIAAILAAVDTEVAAIKTKTDGLTFTVASVVDANIQRVNDVALAGDGGGTPWGP